MSKWVRWTQWSEAGIINFGQMPVTDINKHLREFEHHAKQVLKETNADHVIYCLKLYDETEHLKEVRFYMKAMDDEQFQKRVANRPGVVVYALHKRK